MRINEIQVLVEAIAVRFGERITFLALKKATLSQREKAVLESLLSRKCVCDLGDECSWDCEWFTFWREQHGGVMTSWDGEVQCSVGLKGGEIGYVKLIEGEPWHSEIWGSSAQFTRLTFQPLNGPMSSSECGKVEAVFR